ncbi:MAG TPA: hypothetical protein VFS67_04555 [Polyangiaceae bacterium]|nr:hypothetical protein [Polyangiaceae bacterium]
MHLLLEATIFKIDVLTIDVRVGKAVQRRFDEVIGRRSYSPELARELEKVALGADELLIQVRFVRKVSFQQWLYGALDNLTRAEQAQLISPELRRRVEARLAVAFGALQERGYERGDRLFYRVRPDALRTVLVSDDGRVHLDITDTGKEPGYVVRASYFTPNGVFREPLLRSLFD